jgi:hypothetical protein
MKSRLSLRQPITYCVYPGFLSPDKCLELLAWFSLRFTIRSTHSTVSELSPKEVEQDDIVSDIFKKIHVQIKDIGDYKLRLEKLWCVHTTFTDSDCQNFPTSPTLIRLDT